MEEDILKLEVGDVIETHGELFSLSKWPRPGVRTPLEHGAVYVKQGDKGVVEKIRDNWIDILYADGYYGNLPIHMVRKI